MDTKTVGMAVSASAIGAALAYLGLTNYNDESISINTEEDQPDKKLTQVENTTDAVSKAVNSKVDEIIIINTHNLVSNCVSPIIINKKK